MKKAFPIGSLDKTKRFIKTAEGWISVKKMQKGDNVVIPMIKLADAPDISKPLVPYKGKYTSIHEAQVAWLKKEITHKDFLQEQAAMYAAGIISKKHSNIKLK